MKTKTIVLVMLIALISCSKEEDEENDSINLTYRQEMRDFVVGISQYGKGANPDFVVIPQNGIELITNDGESSGPLNTAYLAAIDGHGQEDLFYGYNNDDALTPTSESNYLIEFLDRSKGQGNTILVTDYCSTQSKMTDAYQRNDNKAFVSFSADHRELDNIPGFPVPIHLENSADAISLSAVKNFLYLINPSNFASKSDVISAVSATNYDLIIMDLYFDEGMAFTTSEIESLKTKANGGQRMVVSYMSIGEAEDYRYYWKTEWKSNKPAWLGAENPEWPGNYAVNYWEEEWQTIIYGNDASYLKMILDAGFDGVYLDLIAAFENYE